MKRLSAHSLLIAILFMLVTMATADAKRKRVLKYDLCEMADPAFFKALDSAISKSIWKNMRKHRMVRLSMRDYNKYYAVEAGSKEQDYVYVVCFTSSGVSNSEQEKDYLYVKYDKRLYILTNWGHSYLRERFVCKCSEREVPRSEEWDCRLLEVAMLTKPLLFLWDPHEAKMTEVELVPELGKLYFDIME